MSDALGVEPLAAYGDALAMQVVRYGRAVDAEPGGEFVDRRPGEVAVDERRDLTL